MKFKINNREWEIVELTQEEIRKHIEEYKYDGEPSEFGKYYGQTYFDEQKIYLDKDLNKQQKKQTLMHELMHCYIGSYLSSSIKNYTEEDLCDISANSHDTIHKIVEDYFNNETLTIDLGKIEIPDIKIDYNKDTKRYKVDNSILNIDDLKDEIKNEALREIKIEELRKKIKKAKDDMKYIESLRQ